MYLLKFQKEILLQEKCMKNIQVSLQNYLSLIHTNINKKIMIKRIKNIYNSYQKWSSEEVIFSINDESYIKTNNVTILILYLCSLLFIQVLLLISKN